MAVWVTMDQPCLRLRIWGGGSLQGLKIDEYEECSGDLNSEGDHSLESSPIEGRHISWPIVQLDESLH